MQTSARVTVLGAGVIGLTTAFLLDARGYRVRIVADRVAGRTSSRVAGAVWFPYLVDEDAHAADWARETYDWLRAGLHRRGFGVSAIAPMYLLASARTDDAAWKVALPEDVAALWCDLEDLPDLPREHGRRTRAAGAWVYPAPIVVPEVHLAWLRAQLGDCDFETRKIESLSELANGAEIVVNCTGRRARALTDDRDLLPALGQFVVATDEHLPRDYGFADDRDEDALIYLVPRGREVVLGGYSKSVRSSERKAWSDAESPAPQSRIRRAILKRFERAGLGRVDEITEAAEWRPARASMTVRLEREGRILHNYGHGGSGYTLAYGCALRVLEMIA